MKKKNMETAEEKMKYSNSVVLLNEHQGAERLSSNNNLDLSLNIIGFKCLYFEQMFQQN